MIFPNRPFRSCWFKGVCMIKEIDNESNRLLVEIVPPEGHSREEEWNLAHTVQGFRTSQYFYDMHTIDVSKHSNPTIKFVPNIICPTQLLHPDAKAPVRSEERAMGHDIRCVAGLAGLEEPDKWPQQTKTMWEAFGMTGQVVLAPGESFIFRTGFKQAIQAGWGCMLWDRSGMGAMKQIHRLAGVIDETYRGEWFVALCNHANTDRTIKAGDKIVQGVYQERVAAQCPIVDSLEDTDRGTGGFGSTGS